MNKDTARINMYNKLFNLAEETPSKAFLDSNLFKNLVGGGPVTARHLFKDGISFRNRTKLINACNELPLTGDPSHGMFRRLLIVPFDAIFVEGKNMNIFLQEELREELPGILNKVIAGYKRLNENNGFTKSLNMERVHNEYKKDSDSIFGWFSECVYKDDVNNNSFTSSKEFYSNYKNYCTFTNIKPKPFNFFSKRLNVVFKQEGVRGLDKSGERNRGYIGYILTREDF
jgi:putative DNA primase/helicase